MDNKTLKLEVAELLSQVAIKLKAVKKFEMEHGEYRAEMGGPEEIYDEEKDDYITNPAYGTDDERWLYTTLALTQLLLESSDPSTVLEKYYTSMC